MIITIVFLLAAVLLIVVATAVSLRRDGYRRQPTAPILRRPDELNWR